jgi:hypothetical protein
MRERYHLIPNNDLRDHISEITCWCHPEPDDEEPSVYIHNSMDGREKFETGERKPS